MKKFLLLIALLYGCIFFANAQWSGNAQVADTKVCTATGQQVGPQIIPDGSGGAIIFWLDARNGNSNNIYYNRLNAAGSPVWSPASVGLSLTNTTDYVYFDQAISDGSGGAFVSWEIDDGNNYSQFVQHINSVGAKAWASSGVLLSGTGSNGFWCKDGSGGVIVAWSDYRADLIDGTPRGYAQRISNAGSKMWGAGDVQLSTAGGLSVVMGIISDGAGGAIISMEDTRNSNYDPVADEYDNIDIFAQRLNSSGAAVWAGAGVPVCIQGGNQGWDGGGQYPYIVPDGSGGAVLAWEDYRNDPSNGNGNLPNEDIFCQRINSNGAAQWTANGVALATGINDQYQVTLMPDGTGGAVATWLDYGSTYHIYTQKVNGTGALQWGANGIAVAAETYYFDYTASPDASNSSLLVTWVANQGDIKAEKIVAANGALSWGGALVCGRSDYEYDPAITNNGGGGAIVSWADDRNNATSGTDIYANRVLPNGTLPVQILSFDVQLNLGYIGVRWATSTEVNSKDFSVQRSLDGANFENITTVPGAGNSNDIRNYSYNDVEGKSFEGKQIFYRIAETDIDGKSFFTEIKKVKIPDGTNTLTLLQNPVQNNALLRYESVEKDNVKLRIVDQLGNVVLVAKQNIQQGINKIKLQTNNLAKGVYEIELTGSLDHKVVRMVKE